MIGARTAGVSPCHLRVTEGASRLGAMNTAPRAASIVLRALVSCSLAAIVLALVACDVGGDCGLLGGSKRICGVCVSSVDEERVAMSACGGSSSGTASGGDHEQGSAGGADGANGPAWPDLGDAPGDDDADVAADSSLDPEGASDAGAVLDGDAPDA